jgi:hypothetical protein
VLVAAVLGPEEREDRELEVVRLALQQVDDPDKLPVGQAEGSVNGLGVKRLLGDLGQVAQSRRDSRRRPRRCEQA